MSRLRWFIVAEIGLLLLIGFSTYPAGDDFLDHFLPMARGCVTCGYNPYFTSWFLYPLSWLPWKANYLVWTALTLAAFVAAAHYFAADPIRVILSFPMMWTLWLGQIDALPLAGLVMGDYALRCRRPLVLGLALVLMATKPQLTLAVMVLYSLYTTSLLRALLMPAVVAVLSFLVWGLDWPLRWLVHRPDLDYTPWLASLWPWGLVAFIPAVLLPSDLSKRRKMLLYASAIGLPFFGSYSYALFLVQGTPWWSIVATYIPILFILFFGAGAARLMVLVPIALLITEIPAAWWRRDESLSGEGPFVPGFEPPLDDAAGGGDECPITSLGRSLLSLGHPISANLYYSREICDVGSWRRALHLLLEQGLLSPLSKHVIRGGT